MAKKRWRFFAMGPPLHRCHALVLSLGLSFGLLAGLWALSPARAQSPAATPATPSVSGGVVVLSYLGQDHGKTAHSSQANALTVANQMLDILIRQNEKRNLALLRPQEFLVQGSLQKTEKIVR